MLIREGPEAGSALVPASGPAKGHPPGQLDPLQEESCVLRSHEESAEGSSKLASVKVPSSEVPRSAVRSLLLPDGSPWSKGSIPRVSSAPA